MSSGCAFECDNVDQVLETAECGHSFCKTCLQVQYMAGSFPCPVCKTLVSRNSFKRAASGATAVSFEKERKIRQRLDKIYNCDREDFADTPQYEDWCEEAEDVAYRLVQGGEEAAQAEQQVKAYKTEHGEAIVARNVRREQRRRAEHAAVVEAVKADEAAWREAEEREAEEARARALAREEVLKQVAKGQVAVGRQAQKHLEGRTQKRLKRDQEAKEQQQEQEEQAKKQQQQAAGGLPRPLGQVAVHDTAQLVIGNSYRGPLSVDQRQHLLSVCKAAHPGP